MQHYALDRDIEIVVVSDHVGFGNGFLLPAGPLREPLSRLKDVDFIVRSRLATLSHGINSDVPSLELPHFVTDEKVHGYVLALDELRRLDEQDVIAADSEPEIIKAQLKTSVTSGKAGQDEFPLIAMAGIANPGRFFKTITDLGLKVETVIQPDHHQFTADDFQSGADAPLYILTEKDAVKCKELKIDQSRVWYAKMTAVPDQRLIDALLERLASPVGGQSDETGPGR